MKRDISRDICDHEIDESGRISYEIHIEDCGFSFDPQSPEILIVEGKEFEFVETDQKPGSLRPEIDSYFTATFTDGHEGLLFLYY